MKPAVIRVFLFLCFFVFYFIFLSQLILFSDPDKVFNANANNILKLEKEDLIIEEGSDGGYHLWIRKKPGIGSVLLTESTMDPKKRLDSFSLRCLKYNSINGDEKRILNGRFLKKNKGIIDSTQESHKVFDRAFHLFIPYVVIYGYSWSRMGEIQIMVGSFLNIKTFSKPYGDWSGATMDNPFVIDLAPAAEQKVEPEGNYLSETVKELSDIAKDSGGKAVFSPDNENLVPKIGELLDEVESGSLDLVLALDTTLSMQDELPYLKAELVPLLRRHTVRFKHLRFGLLFYKDYFEKYLVKPFPFTESLDLMQENINLARALGGKEIPEAVYEALYSAIKSYSWKAESRLIILIGDAPPHPRPRGDVTKEMVYSKARDAGITIHTIILPQ